MTGDATEECTGKYSVVPSTQPGKYRLKIIVFVSVYGTFHISSLLRTEQPIVTSILTSAETSYSDPAIAEILNVYAPGDHCGSLLFFAVNVKMQLV